MTNDSDREAAHPVPTRKEELLSFFLFVAVIAPVFAVLFVGGYGFVVWMYQLLVGPPGMP